MRIRAVLLWVVCFALLQLPAQAPSRGILTTKAPEIFRVLFKTTRGDFVMEAYRKWSPRGVDRLYQLVTTGYFTNNLIFRVEPEFVVQFGIAEQHAVKKFWYEAYIQDEPALQKHTKGIVAFARDKKNSRSTQLFVDMADNPKLDTTVRNGLKGFTPIARVVRGMDVLARFYAKYGKKPAMEQIALYRKGNAYFEEKYPGLDKIRSAQIVR